MTIARRPTYTKTTKSMARARAEANAAAAGEKLPASARRKKQRHIEDDHQKALFDWADRCRGRWPALVLLHAIPNGGTRPGLEAARMKRQGTKPGVPDLDLPVPRLLLVGDAVVHCAGLRIELKRPIVKGQDKPRLSDDQKWWLSMLQDEGHCCCVCYGWDEARVAIEAYLGGSPVPHQWARP